MAKGANICDNFLQLDVNQTFEVSKGRVIAILLRI
jgi:hypothetical protein